MEYAMELIEAGSFLMGSPEDEAERHEHETQHRVTLTKSFCMGKYTVTQAQYKAVMGTNPSKFDGDNLPVEKVCWYDTLIFCNKLSIQERLTPAYSIDGKTNPDDWGDIPTFTTYWEVRKAWDAAACDWNSSGYRLPTEAEWEYACRAGTTTAYNTGDSISDDTGWYKVNSGDITHEVGQKPANAWGLYDMHGNVFEWCWDLYDTYPCGDQLDPLGAPSEPYRPYRVIRGGDWGSPQAMWLRSAKRNVCFPDLRRYVYGFRLARTAQ
jgi:formylglycine-generating enzyme required for sulfatase activity